MRRTKSTPQRQREEAQRLIASLHDYYREGVRELLHALQSATDPAAPEAANGYIPAKMKDKVVAAIGILGPKESGEVTFKAPTAPGDYPFLCSFPGHTMAGMKGVLVVKE